jgi:hypothetical protein
MKTIFILSFVATLLTISASQAQQSPSPAPQPTQTQSQPCGVAPSASKTTIKVPPAWKSKFDKYNPLAGSDLPNGTSSGKAAPPCPPAAPPAQPVPVLHLPPGVGTIWFCNPVVMGADHTTSYVMPTDITEASPIQANTFEADSAKADPKATTSCSALHKDPRTSKFWLAAQ